MNTMFSKRNKNKCTYKNKNSGHKGGKPTNTTNYGQIDYILIEKNMEKRNLRSMVNALRVYHI